MDWPLAIVISVVVASIAVVCCVAIMKDFLKDDPPKQDQGINLTRR